MVNPYTRTAVRWWPEGRASWGSVEAGKGRDSGDTWNSADKKNEEKAKNGTQSSARKRAEVPPHILTLAGDNVRLSLLLETPDA